MTDQFTINLNALFIDTETRVNLTHQRLAALAKKLESNQRHEAAAAVKDIAEEVAILISSLRQLGDGHDLHAEDGSCLLPHSLSGEFLAELPPVLNEFDATLGHALAELANLKNDLVRLQRYELASTVRDSERLLNRYRHWVTRINITL